MLDVFRIEDFSLIWGYLAAMVHRTNVVAREINSTFCSQKAENFALTGELSGEGG